MYIAVRLYISNEVLSFPNTSPNIIAPVRALSKFLKLKVFTREVIFGKCLYRNTSSPEYVLGEF